MGPEDDAATKQKIQLCPKIFGKRCEIDENGNSQKNTESVNQKIFQNIYTS